MVINWDSTEVRIGLTGRSAWPRGQHAEWRASIPDNDLWFAVRGTGKMLVKGNVSIPLAAGTCLWLTPGHIYVGTHDPEDPLVNYYIHFELYDPHGKRLRYDRPRPPERLEAGDGVFVGTIMRRIVELIPFYTPETAQQFLNENIQIAHQLMRGLLMDLDHASQLGERGSINGTRRHHHEVVMRVITQIQDGANARYTVNELADLAGYSPEHFSRIFRAVVGQPPEEFLIRLRIDQAKQLLWTSPMSISEIAHALGYRKPSFFSVQFRQRTGSSPSEYRQRRTMAEPDRRSDRNLGAKPE